MTDKPRQPPGKGVLGWLGRQVGHVKKAVKTDVKPPADKQAPKESAPPAKAKVVYQNQTVHEAPHPDNPDLKLRRTVIDEVIVEKQRMQPPAEGPKT